MSELKYVNLRAYSTASGDYGFFNWEKAFDKVLNNPSEYSPSFALTENQNMYSLVKFHKKAKEYEGFKPIHGVEYTISEEKEIISKHIEKGQEVDRVKVLSIHYPILFLAKNNDGYQNLCKLQTLLLKSTSKRNRIREESLNENAHLLDNLFILSGGNTGYLFDVFKRLHTLGENQELLDAVDNHIAYWKNISKGNYFIELQRDGTPLENEYIHFILPYAIKHGVPVVATNNTYFLNPEDYATHKYFMAHKGKYNPYQGNYQEAVNATPENYLKSNSEMAELFSDIPVALENSVYLAENCQVKLELGKNAFLPELQSPNPNETMNDYFARLSQEGMDRIMVNLYLKYVNENGIVLDENNENISYKPNSLMNNDYFNGFDEWKSLNLPAYSTMSGEKELLSYLKETNLYRKYQERLDYEIEVIQKMKFPSYFLVVSDFIKWAKDNNIPVGAGRGSGAGSLVAYALKITDLDPLQFDLLFERFLNPERVSMPDFDIDFATHEFRDAVIAYVMHKYNVKGKDGAIKVAQIMNVAYYDLKSSVEMAAKSLGIGTQHPMVNNIKKMIGDDEAQSKADEFTLMIEEDDDDMADTNENFLKKAKLANNPEFLLQYRHSPVFKQIIDLAGEYYKQMRNKSVHAAGMIISSIPIDDVSPIDYENGYVTQFNKDDVEAMGLIKFDFLALENLTIMLHAINNVNATRKKNNLPLFTMDTLSQINLYDKNIYENIYANGNTLNVFQFASEGMVNMLKKYKPDNFDDLIALVSLYRPGPLSEVPNYIATKHGFKPINVVAASCQEAQDILNKTYGFMIYQEQVMQFARVYAGYTLGEADMLRRAMGKKKPEEMAKHRKKFLHGALKRDLISEDADFEGIYEKFALKLDEHHELKKGATLDDVYEIRLAEATNAFNVMEKFAAYGFNKSHAAAYALISYQTAWLKHYYPTEYYHAVLHSNIRNKKMDDLLPNILDAQRNGVKIKGVNINYSEDNFILTEKQEIIMPFKWKGMDTQFAKSIVYVRNKILNDKEEGELAFNDLYHFVQSMIENGYSLKEDKVRALLFTGAFDGIRDKSMQYILSNLGEMIAYHENNKPQISNPILRNFSASAFKSSVRKSDIQAMKNNNNYGAELPISYELRESAKLLGFVFDTEKYKLFERQNHEMLSYLVGNWGDKKLNFNQISHTFDSMKTLMQQQIRKDYAEYVHKKREYDNNPVKNEANLPKLKTFASNTSGIMYGYLIEDKKIKAGEGKKRILRIRSGNSEHVLSVRDSSLLEAEMNLFENYFFVLDGTIDKNTIIDTEVYQKRDENGQLYFDEHDDNWQINLENLQYQFYLKDFFPVSNVFKQIIEADSNRIGISNKSRFEGTEEEIAEQETRRILEVLHETNCLYLPDEQEQETGKKKKKKENKNLELPLEVILPNNEKVQIILKDNMVNKFKDDQIYIRFNYNKNILEMKKNNDGDVSFNIKLNALSGNVSQKMSINEFQDMVNGNHVFNTFKNNCVLSKTINSFKYLSEKKNSEYYIIGYIDKINKYGKPQVQDIEFVDLEGNKSKISYLDGIEYDIHYREHAPCVFKINHYHKDGKDHFNLIDIFYEDDLKKQLKDNRYFTLFNQYDMVVELAKERGVLVDVNFEETVPFEDDNHVLIKFQNIDEKVKMFHLDGSHENYYIQRKGVLIEKNDEFMALLKQKLELNDAYLEPLFDFNQKVINEVNLKPNYQPYLQSNYVHGLKLFTEMENHNMNYLYLLNKGSRYVDKVFSLDQYIHNPEILTGEGSFVSMGIWVKTQKTIGKDKRIMNNYHLIDCTGKVGFYPSEEFLLNCPMETDEFQSDVCFNNLLAKSSSAKEYLNLLKSVSVNHFVDENIIKVCFNLPVDKKDELERFIENYDANGQENNELSYVIGNNVALELSVTPKISKELISAISEHFGLQSKDIAFINKYGSGMQKLMPAHLPKVKQNKTQSTLNKMKR